MATAPVLAAPVVVDTFHIDPPSVAPAGMSERAIQRHMLVMVRRLFPDCMIAHVPNGGRRGKLEAAHLKADGVLPGFPDLIITWPGGAAFPEVKDRDGAVSASQKEVLATLHSQGHACGVFRHDRTLHDFLRAHGAPFKPKWPHQFLPPG
ncbi:hypothetical protein GCM10023232_26900 [Sphingosinicella ginsenosidimutans]|uniref:Uncharacterized protein n=1 Tax=Allosphingosinicella ginsenosidimutans TaxID=1176539 RepID=A0A5C6TU01_9SPHN|nr:VRR-NUC domain-containing protein [Sphingosinicella ginsenosidimutans]TXC63699.1 hypothetical protein FRZ32_08530 [Sphingosinicella ginsenosidimutans]